MFVENYELPDSARECVSVSSDLHQLLGRKSRQGANADQSLLVWRRAFVQPELKECFSAPSWPFELLEALPPSPEWPWVLVKGEERVNDANAIREALLYASGTKGAPVGNVHVTLELRSYEERSSFSGGLGWWQTRQADIAGRNAFGHAFVTALISVLERAVAVGSELFTEQMSVIVSKDASSPVATLTPTLHSDKFYGIRETAITSLLENGWEGHGGALFLPACRMDRLWHLRPITIAKLVEQLADELVLRTGSGDILLYDGMVGVDGVASPSNGIPHISPDVPGMSSRLGILMHHRERKARPDASTRSREQ
ncbi:MULTISPECIES: hypothetical protein [unclassified Bradyrhizobium]|uniref:hypothetical protein n=1 Tax=unclassified Bradyrhizobium TaxID=2631580 RepID=UPI0029164CC5|nr:MULTISPECIES: hypothetical protein [unclassified Bradyrhizobium]